jgi:hypothetical protein
MSFGVQNLGVIDQQGTPAIWQSNYADFPNNFIQGRILISTDSGYGIFLDLAASRIQIVDSYFGEVIAQNGLNIVSNSPNNTAIELGGTLLTDTTVNTNGNELNFTGGNISIDSATIPVLDISQLNLSMQTVPGSIDFLTDGSIVRSGGTTDGEFLSTTTIVGTVIVPNITLLFKSASGVNYKIIAQQI